MTFRTPRAVALTALAAMSALLLAGCAGGTEQESSASATATTPVEAAEPSPASTATTSPTPDATSPTCETLIPQSVIDEFDAHDWTYRQNVFRVGSLVIDEGIECVWGDYSVASDYVQIFGWAPISAAAAADARAELLAAGWQRIDDTSGDFITEAPETAVQTKDGYGLTYQFGDGWVILADTKQSLLLIERPDS
ncbi:hypothetical protein [Microbacterium sp. 18062]|uniref:hypothetical protein n=1 Tax=Microbacterium sp. 18062 TaxID=2681410 RepID=UPI0013574EFF|nr:hypothetical protein [Microbacterium sp. 18062]